LQIFISYSHNESDAPIARFLAAGFRAAGYDVWQDESSQPAGESLQADIEKAILESDHALFIVSKLWLQSRWSRLELDRFDRRDHATVRRVPIFRLPYDQLKLPVELIDLKGVTWLEDDPHHDARFWEVYCAVTDTDPGPRETWNASGEKVQKGKVLPPVVRPVAPTLESLRCDRGVQWSRVTDLTPDPSHDVMIVPGCAGQAHDHFSRRVRELLTPLPPRSIVTITWRKRPAGREEFLATLANDLGVSNAGLRREMAERMSDTNLVLLHPCIRALYMDPVLIRYYREWLPELLADVKPRRSLKCLQPVEWPIEGSPLTRALAWLRVKRATGDEGRREAEQLIEEMRSGTADGIRVIRLQDLTDISDADLDEFCQIEQLTDVQRTWFLSKIRSRQPDTSEEVLESIDAFLPDARSMT
jgi:hypothetical protein